MEANHASRGRRTLEEIRQKRAAERIHKTPSGSDLDVPSNPYVGSKAADKVRELEMRNAQLGVENKSLSSQLQQREVEKETLMKRLNDMEHNLLPSLRKSLNDVSMEKDAAVVAREDLLVQLRTAKKRLKEAEEDQYKAEEDAAALRAELNSLQEQDLATKFTNVISKGVPVDHVEALENEISNLKSQLQEELTQRQQEKQRLSEEQIRASSLMEEKQELERRLVAMSKQSLEEASEDAARREIFMRNKEKTEKQLHDMALMVERLENSRQKLLTEIDSQSSEIEHLFDENSSLSSLYKDAVCISTEWENQVKECLKKNQELRDELDKVRSDLASIRSRSAASPDMENVEEGPLVSKPLTSTTDNLLLNNQLAKEQSKSEALSSEVMQLSADLKHATQAYNNLTRMLYKLVLRNIESNLMKMKQESFATVR